MCVSSWRRSNVILLQILKEYRKAHRHQYGKSLRFSNFILLISIHGFQSSNIFWKTLFFQKTLILLWCSPIFRGGPFSSPSQISLRFYFYVPLYSEGVLFPHRLRFRLGLIPSLLIRVVHFKFCNNFRISPQVCFFVSRWNF